MQKKQLIIDADHHAVPYPVRDDMSEWSIKKRRERIKQEDGSNLSSSK
ncbi:MAG: hypothetical protein H6Q68_2426 [Firmicutes bacterium]|nr:hypothetical protein [Bacillota bacterium]